MPLYSYKCPHCGLEEDIQHPMNIPKEELPVCAQCSTLLDKQITAPRGFKFNGGGYYETDFKHK